MTAKQLNQKLAAGGVKFFGETVVVARERAVEVRKSGLVIPSVAQRKQQFAAVVAYGEKSKLRPAWWRRLLRRQTVHTGDAVYVPSYGGVLLEQKMGGEIYVLEALYDKDILISYRGDADVELEVGGELTTGQ